MDTNESDNPSEIYNRIIKVGGRGIDGDVHLFQWAIAEWEDYEDAIEAVKDQVPGLHPVLARVK